MANTIKFEIQNESGVWKHYKNAALPFKFELLLDEQLDNATVMLTRVKKQYFSPLTKARVTIETDGIAKKTLHYLVSNDEFAEAPVGSGRYNHTLMLIELTKYLESFQLETLCFTNPAGRDYSKSAPPPLLKITGNDDSFLADPKLLDYKAQAKVGEVFKLPNLNNLFNEVSTDAIVSVRTVNSYVEYRENDNPTPEKFDWITFTIEPGENIITITYKPSGSATILFYEEFTIFGVEENYAHKPWTVKEVINRVLALAEPLRKGELPRFTFNVPKGREKIFNQIAPEFTFTRATLREALQTIGGFIHAEPRLTENNEIVFDFYGAQEYATYKTKSGKRKRLSEYKYKTLTGRHGIEQACNTLDSYVDNLVNRLAWEKSTIAQPYGGGNQTLRTETAYARGEENDSYFFNTAYPIEHVEKFEYIDNDGKAYDITPFIYESTIYNNLSSYWDVDKEGNETNYYQSKSYALHYTQGQRGVKGFFFKAPDIWGASSNAYAIVNILYFKYRITITQYTKMKFRLTYSPIYSTRVPQHKQYIGDYLPMQRTINYTQSDNSVETRFFGENIKGAVERMGNVEKTYTINLRDFDNIPTPGQLWDDDYYIASVAVSVGIDLFEVSVGLSKHFNRRSQYVGAASYRRIYEVSEVMVQQRHSIYSDYLVVTDYSINPFEVSRKPFFSAHGIEAFKTFFTAEESEPIAAVAAYGTTYNGTQCKKCLLPVVCSAFGNTLEFTWEYKDNFSAGDATYVVEKNSAIEGSFNVGVNYGDSYGRIYYYNFSLLTSAQADGLYPDADKLPEISHEGNPGYIAGTSALGSNSPVIMRKDSREAIKCSYCVNLVTDNKDMVIGSALASRNPLVWGKEETPVLCVLENRVNKFGDKLDEEEYAKAEKLDGPHNVSAKNSYLSIAGKPAQKDGRAWAYVIPPYAGETKMVVDEQGNQSEYTPVYGGEIILAKNIDIKKGDIVGAFTMHAIHDIYEYLEAKKEALK